MSEEEKKAFNYLKKYIEWETAEERNLEGDIKTILTLIEKQERVIKTRSKEIESLYKMMTVKDDKIEKLKDELKEERKFNIETLETLKECVHKDQIKGIIEKHKKFLLNEISKYEDDNNRKTILYAITRLCFLLTDIFKEDNK